MANVIVSETPEALADRAAMDFLALVQRTLDVTGRPPGWPSRFRVALAGGLTPQLFYARLAQSPYRESIPWEKMHFYWGDERCVPKEHPDSNYRMAYASLLSQVPVRPSQVYRMRGEDAPPRAAQDYEKILRDQFGMKAEWPEFDLVLLGLGPDGHTASLFAGTPGILDYNAPQGRRYEERMGKESPSRWVVHNVVRSLQTVRLTLTLASINAAKSVWFLATGAKKAAAYARVQEGPNPMCPSSLVSPSRGELRWYIDRAVIS